MYDVAKFSHKQSHDGQLNPRVREEAMLQVQAHVVTELFDAVAATAADPKPGPALARLITSRPELGSRERSLAEDPAGGFALHRFGDARFWVRQRALRDALAERIDESVATVVPYLPPVPDERLARVTVLPVPGLSMCYGAGGGRQVFGLYEAASEDETVLFCSHTYLHEVSTLVSTGTVRAAERDPGTASALRLLILSLIRNEGIANFAVLDQVRRLHASGVPMPYFDYAPLIDDHAARARALTAARQLLGMVTDENATALLPRVTSAFKNPRLPVINLVGIHVAEAVATAHGVDRLINIDGREPYEFFQAYLESPDPLREQLFGKGMADAAVFGAAPATQAAR